VAHAGQDESALFRFRIEALFRRHVNITRKQARLAGAALALPARRWYIDTGFRRGLEEGLRFENRGRLPGARKFNSEASLGCLW